MSAGLPIPADDRHDTAMQVRSWVALALLALLAGLLARDASDWQPDNRIGSWVQRGGARARHELLTEEFGGDEFALIRVEGLSLDWDRKGRG